MTISFSKNILQHGVSVYSYSPVNRFLCSVYRLIIWKSWTVPLCEEQIFARKSPRNCVYTWDDSHPSQWWRLVDAFLSQTALMDWLLSSPRKKVSCMLLEITKASAEMKLNLPVLFLTSTECCKFKRGWGDEIWGYFTQLKNFDVSIKSYLLYTGVKLALSLSLSLSNGRTQIEGVWEQSAEEDIWN